PNLMERPRLVILNKVDVPEARELAEFVEEDLRARGLAVFQCSTATHEGLRELTFALGRAVEHIRAQYAEAEKDVPRLILRPRENGKSEPFTITFRKKDGQEFYLIRGDKPELWVRQTDFDNDEAVGYLADRLNRLGIEDALLKAGAQAGDMVVIGPEDSGFIFDWEPTVSAGAELLGPRGSDMRLDENERATRAQKREQYYERMDSKAAAREDLLRERESGLWTDPAQE
ncbi:MAG: Obg family GTPase CgtA, partial [Actinomycetaceae bacterium]|nr:Obg family GTPase CgtA [Actinomycetaceae bacterium]